jgi:hypothetical protein
LAAYKNNGRLFEGLSIWEEEKYRGLQGTYPMIFLSFANVKETSFFAEARKRYATELEEKGIVSEWIRKYGFVFEGKKVLIG